MATEQQFASYRERVKTFSEQLNEPDWMLNKRLDALELADELAEPVIERPANTKQHEKQFGSLLTRRVRQKFYSHVGRQRV